MATNIDLASFITAQTKRELAAIATEQLKNQLLHEFDYTSFIREEILNSDLADDIRDSVNVDDVAETLTEMMVRTMSERLLK